MDPGYYGRMSAPGGRTATPAMARAINDRLALDLLLEHGPLSAPQLRELTGLSRPTVADLVERLREAGLVRAGGESGEERRGPNARLYALVAERAHVAGVDVRRSGVEVVVADLAGRTVGQAYRPPGRDDVTGGIVAAVQEAAGERPLHAVVLGAPGLVHPRTSDLGCAENIPGWSQDLLPELRSRLAGGGLPPQVLLENETNLAAVAELRVGAARGREDFVLFWLDEGVGGAVVLGGRVRRGMSGGAGEFGLLETAEGEFCATVARGVAGGTGAAGWDRALAERVAVGVATVVKVLDPGLVVLGGRVGSTGGDGFAGAVGECLRELTKVPTEVRASGVEGNAVLQGAVLTALDLTRDRVFSPVS